MKTYKKCIYHILTAFEISQAPKFLSQEYGEEIEMLYSHAYE